MNSIFFGTPTFVLPVLETLFKHHTVVGIVTTPDEKIGRKQLVTPTPVKQFALSHNLPVFTPDTLKELTQTLPELKKLQPDLFVVAAYGKIIPEEVITFPKYGSINIHPSRLPDYRGPSPLQETILSGDTETAVTIIKMDADVDHGPILAQEELAISPTDTFLSLAEKAFLLGATLTEETIQQIKNNTLSPQEQDHSKATFTAHVQKEDGFFDIQNPPEKTKLDRMIRAYYPWPGVWTRIRIKNNESRIMKLLPEQKLQLEGGKPITKKDFLNGYPELSEEINKLFAE